MSTLIVDSIEDTTGAPLLPDDRSLALAWCVFNGATGAILNSYNVSAVTSNSLVYNVYPTTSFPDNCSVSVTQNTVYGYSACSSGKQADGSVNAYVSDSTSALYPSAYISVVVYG